MHILSMQWDGSFLEVHIDRHLIGSTKLDAQIPAKMRLANAPSTIDSTKKQDFSRQNADVKLRRKDRAATPPVLQAGQRAKTKEEDFHDLAEEVLTLRDDIEAVRSGKLYRAKSIGRVLRKLLEPEERRHMGVLRRCAGRIGEGLILYTNNDPTSVPPIQPDVHLISDMRAHAAGVYTNPVDLNIWLTFRGGTFNGINYTHGAIIRAVGNTIAAHGDQNLSPVVEVLQQFETEMTIVAPMNFVISYLLDMGREIMLLAEVLIAKDAENAKGS